VNPVDAFAVAQRLLLCHLPAVAYHRIYINAVVVSRGGFAAVFACLKPHFPAAKLFYDLRLDLRFVWYNGCELNDMYQTH
jgi:hypothetical protein